MENKGSEWLSLVCTCMQQVNIWRAQVSKMVKKFVCCEQLCLFPIEWRE